MFRQDIKEFQSFKLPKGSKSFATDGCAVCCVFFIVEQEKPLTFNIKDIKRLVTLMHKKGYLDKEFTIQGADGWKGCFEVLGLPVKEVLYFPSANYICDDDEREVLYLKKPGYQHFVPANGFGVYSWDSLGRRDAQKDYYIYQKRIIRL